MSTRFAALVAASLLAVGCGGGGESAEGTAEAPESPAAAAEASSAVDGEALFQEKTCNVCHAFGSRMVGPDLSGVTERRSREWIVALLLHTDSMLNNDPDAMALLEEYGTPMLPAQMTAEEADAIYEYLVGK